MRLALALVCALVGSASADRRMFTYTFEYRTLAEGHTTLSLWHTETRDDLGGDGAQRLEHILEVEHGITEHWDAGVLLAFDQVHAPDPLAEQSLSFHEVRLQNRYRFADRSEWPVDLQLQLDASKHFGASAYDLELRAVIARDVDKVTVALNVLGLASIGKDVPDTYDLGWAGGATYELHPKLNAGVETFGAFDSSQASVGPALALAPSSKLWLTLTAAFGLTDETPELAARAILGIEL